jgi:hypothetical protein
MMSYPTLPVWLAGLGYLLLHRDGRRFAPLGWAYLFILVAMMTAPNGRTYYVAPAYPMLFAAGALWFENWLSRKSEVDRPNARVARPTRFWLGGIYAALILVFGALTAPIAIPVLPVETYIRYTRALHLQQPRIETHQLGPLPQLYADMFGWEEMVQVVARAYNALPPEERARTAIVTQNYGQAGAIDFFGGKYGLPKAISSHQSYYFWGTRGYTGDIVLDVGESYQHLARVYHSVQPVGHVYHPYSMPYEHFTIYLCRGPKYPLKEVWRPNWD